MSFHINTKTGKVGPCSAKPGQCPFGKKVDHYETADGARKAYEAFNDTFSSEAKVKTLSDTAKLALASDLAWAGKSPKWFKADAAQQEKTFGTKPEIIDVIPSSVGNLAVVWSTDTMDSVELSPQLERGYNCNRIAFQSMKTGEVMAYIKMGFIDDSSLERSFGNDEWTPFAWADDALGGQFGFETYPDADNKDTPNVRELTGEAKIAMKRNIWAHSYGTLNITPPDFDTSELTWGSLHNLTASHAPKSEAILDRELDLLRSELRNQIQGRKIWDGTPSINYIKRAEALNGEGIGHALYIYGARMQGKYGRVLSASTIQTSYAEKSWRLMKKLGLPVKTVTKKRSYNPEDNETVELFNLDFRKNVEGV